MIELWRPAETVIVDELAESIGSVKNWAFVCFCASIANDAIENAQESSRDS